MICQEQKILKEVLNLKEPHLYQIILHNKCVAEFTETYDMATHIIICHENFIEFSIDTIFVEPIH